MFWSRSRRLPGGGESGRGFVQGIGAHMGDASVDAGEPGGMLAPVRAMGQRANRLPRVALVYGASLAEISGADPTDLRARAFMHGLRDQGLVEGRDISIERRAVEGRPERLPTLMQQVVDVGVDVIVTFGGPGVRAAQSATDRIAIVAVVDGVLDTGTVESLRRPGRNLTGIGENSSAIEGKRLQILKEAAPAISRVAVITYRPLPGTRPSWRVELDAAARAMRLDVLWLGADAPDELDAAFTAIVRERADALYTTSTFVTHPHRQRIADFALKQRLRGDPQDIVQRLQGDHQIGSHAWAQQGRGFVQGDTALEVAVPWSAGSAADTLDVAVKFFAG